LAKARCGGEHHWASEACALRLDRLGHRVYAGVRSEEHARGLRDKGLLVRCLPRPREAIIRRFAGP